MVFLLFAPENKLAGRDSLPDSLLLDPDPCPLLSEPDFLILDPYPPFPDPYPLVFDPLILDPYPLVYDPDPLFLVRYSFLDPYPLYPDAHSSQWAMAVVFQQTADGVPDARRFCRPTCNFRLSSYGIA